jgi:hypothetical protein
MGLRLIAVTFAAALAFAGQAQAEDPRPNSSPPKVNKDADNINAANPRVFHAGPGKPLQGGVWTSPSAAAAKKTEKPAAGGH